MSNMTIKDIAEKAGVSKSTVSRVINNTGYVSGQIRERVNRIINEYAYQPSAIARGLSTKDSCMIGVVVPTASDGFFGRILEGISEVADKKGYTVMFCTTDNDPAKEQRALATMRGQRVRGLLITPAAGYLSTDGFSKLRSALENLGIPVVLIDRAAKNLNWDGVYFDNFNGAYIATENIVRSGYKKIGTITSDTSLQLGSDRLAGFRQALADAGIREDERFILTSNQPISTQQAFRMTCDWIRDGRLPEAVLLSNGAIVNGFLKAILAHGLSPDRDVYTVGFDYVQAVDILNMRYSYLSRDADNMGRIAMQMLLDHFDQKIPSRREYIVPAKLIVRECGGQQGQ